MLHLAWRNVWRQRGRSISTILAVVTAVVFTLLSFAFSGATRNNMYQSLVRNTGHLQVHTAQYRQAEDFRDTLIFSAQEVKDQLESTFSASSTSAVTATLDVPALLFSDERSRPVAILGQSAFDGSPNSPKQGRMPKNTEEIALSTSLATALKLEIGQVVYAYAPATDGQGAAAYTIVGLIAAYKQQDAIVSLEAAQRLAAPDAVTRFNIHLVGTASQLTDDTLQALKGSLSLKDGLQIETWKETNASAAQFLELMTPMTLIFTFVFFVLAGLLLLNTIYLSLMERTREFGVILAVGATERQVISMVFLESLLLCLTGLVLGVILNWLLMLAMSGGVPTELVSPAAQDFGLSEMLYPELQPSEIMMTVVFAFVTGILAALWPAYTAARLQPAEAMRFTA